MGARDESLAGATGRGRGRGALIVFEGIDRCGKTTQCTKLVEHLCAAGVAAEMWRFPDRTTAIGAAINDYLSNKANLDDAVVHLLFVANRFEKRAEMLRLLESGVTLVVDRYSYSGVAYTAAKGIPHLGTDYCRSVEVGLPAPDLVLYMDISPEASAARGGFGGERYEKTDFQRKVIEQFKGLMDQQWARIDAVNDIDSIHNQIITVTEPVMRRVAAGAPLVQLWPAADTEPCRSDAQRQGDTVRAAAYVDGPTDAAVLLQIVGATPTAGKQLQLKREHPAAEAFGGPP